MLACARIGAIHSVVFGGFSADSLADRINDCDSNLIITADFGVRGGKQIPLKENADNAAEKASCLKKMIVVKKTNDKISWNDGRDFWYHELMKNSSDVSPPENMNSEDPLFILYTSGSTGKPKGVLVPHRSRILTLFGMAVEYGCYSPDDRFLAIAPMCHGAGMIFSLAPIFFGGYAEIMDSFDPEVVLKTMKNDNITGFFGVPTHFHGILSLEQSILNNTKSHHLKSIISNAAALPLSLIHI